MTQHKRWRTSQTVQQRAVELRAAQTPAETTLWAKLRRNQLLDLKFRRQHPIGPFIADFCCVEKKLIVELDGDSHADRTHYDDDRTAWLAEQGYTIIRFTNQEIRYHLDEVLEEIASQCRQERPPP